MLAMPLTRFGWLCLQLQWSTFGNNRNISFFQNIRKTVEWHHNGCFCCFQMWRSHVFHFRWIFFKLTHSSRNCFAWVNIPAFLVYIFYPIWPLKMTENRLTQNFRKTKNRTLIFVDLEPLMNNMMVFMSSAA